MKTEETQEVCQHGDAVKWNAWNGVVQCHRCGTAFPVTEDICSMCYGTGMLSDIGKPCMGCQGTGKVDAVEKPWLAPVLLNGVHLTREGEYAVVYVERGGKSYEILREHLESSFDHTVTAAGIRAALTGEEVAVKE